MKLTEGKRLQSSDFVLVNKQEELAQPSKEDLTRSAKDSGIYDTFGQVNPLLSTGEWCEDDIIEMSSGRGSGIFTRIVNFLYS